MTACKFHQFPHGSLRCFFCNAPRVKYMNLYPIIAAVVVFVDVWLS